MNTLTIDSKIYRYAEMLAKREKISITEMVERLLIKAFTTDMSLSECNVGEIHSWRNYKVSPEVMAMTFSERKHIPVDYRNEYCEAITSKEQ